MLDLGTNLMIAGYALAFVVLMPFYVLVFTIPIQTRAYVQKRPWAQKAVFGWAMTVTLLLLAGVVGMEFGFHSR